MFAVRFARVHLRPGVYTSLKRTQPAHRTTLLAPFVDVVRMAGEAEFEGSNNK
jgi:hypothetical protein